jgi:hypothetical protein
VAAARKFWLLHGLVSPRSGLPLNMIFGGISKRGNRTQRRCLAE